jgi:hypothetical protein
VELRLAVLDILNKHTPDVGWQLLVELLPRSHDTSRPSPKSRFRETGASKTEAPSYAMVWESQRAIVSRALARLDDRPERFVVIINALGNVESEQRASALCQTRRRPLSRFVIHQIFSGRLETHDAIHFFEVSVTDLVTKIDVCVCVTKLACWP